tara:strand:+ start:262 stop:462 length:201 start_codon:yes stop_codon:yes gene_type:complete
MGIAFIDERSTLPGVEAATLPTGFRGGLPGMTGRSLGVSEEDGPDPQLEKFDGVKKTTGLSREIVT